MERVKMNKDWFEEKATQIEPGGFIAFGIQCSSRYGKKYELIDMLNFCEQCACKRVNKYITSLFYDSKACICDIEYNEEQSYIDGVHDIILNIANKTLSQHAMDGFYDGYIHNIENNHNVGLSLEDQAQALAYKCCLTEKCPAEFLTDGYCPKGIFGLDMPFGKDCLCYVVKDNDWLEYLENRQIPVDNSVN